MSMVLRRARERAPLLLFAVALGARAPDGRPVNVEELKRRSAENDLPAKPSFEAVNDLVVKARLAQDSP